MLEISGNISAFLWGKWAFLLILPVVFAVWRHRELRHYIEQVQKTPSELLSRIFFLLRTSSLLALFLFLILSGTIIYYDYRLESVSLHKTEVVTWSPLPPTDRHAEDTSSFQQNILSEMYQGADSRENQLDLLKQRYEEAFVTYYYLKRCGIVDSDDFHIINKALFDELVRLNTPATLQLNILSAAKGSYTEMYSQSPCNPQTIASLEQQYITYLDQLRTLNAASDAVKDNEILINKQ